MNYLAHAFLSFSHPELLVGQMISDFVKGRSYLNYPLPIRNGIVLHRHIDGFTDQHPASRQARQFLRPAAGLYAGAFLDIAYDHFLANDPLAFPSAGDLQQFSAGTYQTLQHYFTSLPPGFQLMFPYMRQHDWLYGYRFTDGVLKSFTGLAKRAAYLSDAAPIYQAFEENYAALRQCYELFFPALRVFVLSQPEITALTG